MAGRGDDSEGGTEDTLFRLKFQQLKIDLTQALDHQRRTQEELLEGFLGMIDLPAKSGRDCADISSDAAAQLRASPEEQTYKPTALVVTPSSPSQPWPNHAAGSIEKNQTYHSSDVLSHVGSAGSQQGVLRTIKEHIAWLDEILSASPGRRLKMLEASLGVGHPKGFPSKASLSPMGWYDWWVALKEPHREGCLAKFISSKRFQFGCAVVIVLNAVLIITATDHGMQVALQLRDSSQNFDHQVHVLEMCFLSFYIFELILKLFVHRLWFFFNDDAGWNAMDVFLVGISVFDAVLTDSLAVGANMTFLRTFRMFKVSKMLRTVKALKFITELRVMLGLLISTMLQLFWAIFLIAFLLVLFSILFVQGATHYLEEGNASQKEMNLFKESFGSVLIGMLSLFEASSGGNDWGEFYHLLRPTGFVYGAIFLFYIIFFMISVVNIVTSIFVDKAMKLAAPTPDMIMLEMQREHLASTREFLSLCQSLGVDQDEDGVLSHDDMQRCMSDEKIREQFELRGVSFEDFHTFYQMLAANGSGKGVDILTFAMSCMRLKGSATSLELHTLDFEMKMMYRTQCDLSALVKNQYSELKGLLHDIGAKPGFSLAGLETKLDGIVNKVNDLRLEATQTLSGGHQTPEGGQDGRTTDAYSLAMEAINAYIEPLREPGHSPRSPGSWAI